MPDLADYKFGSVLESDDAAGDRTLVIAPIPLQYKYPVEPSNEADMQDALIAAHLLHICPASDGHRAREKWIGSGSWGRDGSNYAYWIIKSDEFVGWRE